MKIEFGTYDENEQVSGWAGWISTTKHIIFVGTNGKMSNPFEYPDQIMSKESLYENYKAKLKEEDQS